MGFFASFCCNSIVDGTFEGLETRLDGVGWLNFGRLYGGRGMVDGTDRAARRDALAVS
jgi:hypothetical protein